MELSNGYIVAESLYKDVGRGIARLDPEDIAGIGAEVGDVVAITGKSTAVARLMPQYRELRGKKAVQLDALLRDNAGVGPGEKVRVEKVSFLSGCVKNNCVHSGEPGIQAGKRIHPQISGRSAG